MGHIQIFHDCNLDDGDPLRVLLEGTARATGALFFKVLVENLAKALNTKCAWITEFIPALRKLKALAFWVDGELIPDFEVAIDDTPCEAVIDTAQLVFYPDNIQRLFPRSLKLKELGAVSYIGVPLMDSNRAILGHLAVIHDAPLGNEPQRLAIFQIFAARASAELQRIRAESEARKRENKLSRLVASAMDAIIELDRELTLLFLNPSAEKLLDLRLLMHETRNFSNFLTLESRKKLVGLIDTLSEGSNGRKQQWVPEGLVIVDTRGASIVTEATLSTLETDDQRQYLLILRNINDRLEAERKISSLSEETAYLKEQINALGHFKEIIGQSRPLKRVLQSAEQVARSDATVLIMGETGTGKELIARAIHSASLRSRHPFITVNCAALPEKLFESELFGHESGAFTSAGQRRIGRFELADGGTLFLDEVSELGMDVQAKLLRVLQEGTFERLGGSKTLSVDVRVIAATNRKLDLDILDHRFRADLFYRLNVYPIMLPPLRDRKEDIPLLADYFVRRISARIRKIILRTPASTLDQLMAYTWPGNIRELKNVIERAIITSPSTDLRLPEPLGAPSAVPNASLNGTGHRTSQSLMAVERKHIADVLEATGWRISGPKGAALILQLNPSTLRYRIKKLGLHPLLRVPPA